jgi:hypothetical protein
VCSGHVPLFQQDTVGVEQAELAPLIAEIKANR